MEKIQKNIKQCEMCRIPATNLCFECFMYFCDSCYKIVHNMKISKQHKKEAIDYYVPMDIKCELHPNDRINLFCVDENGNKLFNFNILL